MTALPQVNEKKTRQGAEIRRMSMIAMEHAGSEQSDSSPSGSPSPGRTPSPSHQSGSPDGSSTGDGTPAPGSPAGASEDAVAPGPIARLSVEKENVPPTASTTQKRARSGSDLSDSDDEQTEHRASHRTFPSKRRRLHGPTWEMMEVIRKGHEEERRMREEDQRRRNEHERRMLAFMEASQQSHLDFQDRLLDTIASLKD